MGKRLKLLQIIMVICLAVPYTVSGQYSTVQARAMLKKQTAVFTEVLSKDANIHVLYQMKVVTNSQTESVRDSSLIDIKKIGESISFQMDDKYLILASGTKTLYYMPSEKAMQYAEDTLRINDKLQEMFFSQLVSLIDSATNVSFDEKGGIKNYELQYLSKKAAYENVRMQFSASGNPLKIVIKFRQIAYQPYAFVEADYKIWDTGVREKKEFPYFGKYIRKTEKGYEPLPELGKVQFYQFLNSKKQN